MVEHRPRSKRAVTVPAGLFIFAALVAPHQLSALRWGAWVSLPVEGIVGASALLLLPARAGRVLAIVLGAVLGLLAVVKIVDLGFSSVLARQFDPLLDWVLLADGLDFLGHAVGRPLAVVTAILAVVTMLALAFALSVAVLQVTRVAVGHRVAASRVLVALALLWVVALSTGAQLVPGVPFASHSATSLVYDKATRMVTGYSDRRRFAAEAAVDPFRETPPDQLLSGLRGKDVVLAFVESYGRSAVEDPTFAPGVGAVLADGDRRLSAAGFAARSAYLTSPTSGGGSWLAHSTLLSGLWIDNQQRYTDLLASHRLSLTGAFGGAGWRTVGVMPGITVDWPEGAFYRYDQVYDAHHLGYRGPSFSWATMPDQYTLAEFERLERTPDRRAPVMAVVPLVSSHAPWAPLPRMVPQSELGDGSIFDPMVAGPGDPPEAILTRDPSRVRADYRRSIEYSLDSLISYLETSGDENLVLVFLGDHQPAPVVVGADASRDVPITIVARDAAVLDRIADWHWTVGLKPAADAPVWRMDGFRDRFLTAFGS